MVIHNQSFEEQIFRLISEAKEELQKKESQKVELDKEVEALHLELQSYTSALRGYQKRNGKQEQSEIDWSKLMMGAKTHKDQIVIAMRQLGGVARPNQLTDILYSQGFIKSYKRPNAYQIVQVNLAQLVDKGIVEKMDTGEYKLIGAQAVLPHVT